MNLVFRLDEIDAKTEVLNDIIASDMRTELYGEVADYIPAADCVIPEDQLVASLCPSARSLQGLSNLSRLNQYSGKALNDISAPVTNNVGSDALLGELIDIVRNTAGDKTLAGVAVKNNKLIFSLE